MAPSVSGRHVLVPRNSLSMIIGRSEELSLSLSLSVPSFDGAKLYVCFGRSDLTIEEAVGTKMKNQMGPKTVPLTTMFIWQMIYSSHRKSKIFIFSWLAQWT